MNKIPQLYEKLPNGRYAPWKEPKRDESSQIFRKIGNRYEPAGALYPHDDYLTEGVWVVTRGRGSKHIASGEYVKGLFQCEKLANLEALPMSQLGFLQKQAEAAFFSVDGNGLSPYEAFVKRAAYLLNNLLNDGWKKCEGDNYPSDEDYDNAVVRYKLSGDSKFRTELMRDCPYGWSSLCKMDAEFKIV